MAQSGRQESQPSPTGIYEDNEARRGQSGTPLESNIPLSQLYQQQQFSSNTRAGSFAMNSLTTTLPDLSYQNYNQLQTQRFVSAPSSSGLVYQMPNVQQFPSAQALGPSGNTQYNMPYQGQFQGHFSGLYAQGHSPTPPHLHHTGSATSNQFYLNQGFMGQQQQQSSPYLMQPGQYSPQGQMYPPVPSPGQYGARNSFSEDTRFQIQRPNESLGLNYSGGGTGRSSSIPATSPSQSSVVRGPPRKPRQSGHAIWIGNLPPQTELMNLVLHVCKEAPGLESLFLISKSNCAFANFKDEEKCAAAQAKIHDSRFQTVRLVSRLRRSSAGTPTGVVVPTGPAALSPPNPPLARTPSPDTDSKSKQVAGNPDHTVDLSGEETSPPTDKFFVVKSLTVEDLELSVRNGIWATQSHNEESLNQAFKTADNVYLIFSANKSGEYFGYARMISPINDDPAAAIEFAPKAQTVEDPELPKAISTPATEFAPKGRIIDDSARGTIFWEVERDEEEEEDSESNKSDQGESPPSKAWGKPFKIEWVSTTRLPFYRTRGLRNPWNSNREVKIARDGTELETSVGRRLVNLFHRIPSPVTQPLNHLQGMPVPLIGYPPVRAPFP